jgi:hypothetical protein
MGVYSLRELEKLLPSVGSINGMQVKDYVQTLLDESQIRVEKIGSGNWYWSFKSDAKKSKENMLNKLKDEECKLTTSIANIERTIEEETAERKEDDGMLEGSGIDRKGLMTAHEALTKETEVLDRELALYSDNDPTEMLRKVEETKELKRSAMAWTDNIESLECYIIGLLGDRTAVAQLMQTACGSEYIIGEGLKDL